ncbi:sulfotransferase family 2 domain-containing protein [Parahalioglobus pacificus]|uniref:Sulfotransferase family protein n=1 Tax=Parahalioglobus pacificus TaxID=930806 RepID=A0A918XMX6_9GAMM|nr:sulfotransferase family 2 domain-containing protein [Halioglobus pacificus]GHD37904.1 hypothetical protein GCM10007053_27540 [Halioglobus pacificus]
MRHVLLHGHVFKNAGTTLDWALQRCFGDGFVDHRRDDLMRSQGGKHIMEMLEADESIVAISSHHMPRDIVDTDQVSFHPIYMLRHPILRIRSVYDFERKQEAQTPGAQAAKRMDFREYVDWRMQPKVAPTIRNFQTRYLAGRLPPRFEKMADFDYFELAMQTLHQVRCVGIVEQYDASMVLIENTVRKRFKAINLAHVPQNVTGQQRAALSQEERIGRILDELGGLQAKVLEHNSFDMALYEASRHVFTRRLEDIPELSARLQKFRKRCTVLERQEKKSARERARQEKRDQAEANRGA